MMNLAASFVEDELDYRAWIAMQRVQAIRPPYASDFQVTPLSKFCDLRWVYPAEWLPAGHRTSPWIDFSTERAVPQGKFHLSVSQHALLIQQLKEVMVAMIYLRTLLPGRIDAAKPLTILNDGTRLSQLFANFAAAGVKSLSELTQDHLSIIFETIPVEPKAHAVMIGHVKDIVFLSEKELISDPLTVPKAYIEMREVAEDTTLPRGAKTLDEDDTSFLLGHSRTYIELAPIIAIKIKMYRKRALSAVRLMEWACVHLPVRKALKKRAIAYQLEWLVKISAYNLIVFHLGSRASEALTLDGHSISRCTDEDTQFHAQITLMIFKGSKRGAKRTYTVHPYLLKVNAAIHAMADALGGDLTEPVFSKKNRNLEICTNNLNKKIRQFAEMHGRPVDMTSHSWRFTLADIVTQAADTPFAAIQYQLDHDYMSESIGYGLSGPSGADIRKSAIEGIGRSIDSFVDKCFEASALGGPQGEMIKTSINDGAKPDQVKSQMRDFGLFPLKVGRDRFCLKQAHARGACSAATGDDFPEIEHCRADCQFQAQLPSNLIDWEAFINRAADFYGAGDISLHEKIRKTDELLQYVRAWPQLRQKLEEALSANRSLKRWFF
ncbi:MULTISPECIES: hypothetical protein [unclassified Rhizobium]|uniref:hypothetical protein n=1 Tax=unclassified Rhizobium TaxID=2613769 RepID=UPI001AE3C3D9|nr:MULTISPECIES: hypothetical protein [unclassified Rhizobium]MBP2461497.1 hypothetical protein [Rhizobium sp. PvP014]MBP2528892.1 hypothetical protein [Rhizobium sp. PvP099]